MKRDYIYLKNAYDVAVRAAELAMETLHTREVGLAREIGCNPKSIKKILEGYPTKLDQEAYFRLFALAGMFKERL